jgi:hypothetical protein
MDYAEHEIAATKTNVVESGFSVFARPSEATARARRLAVVAVVEDGMWISQELEAICEFLDIRVITVPGRDDLRTVLRDQTPMAVVCELDGAGQDGCHIMKTVASHDPSLPILLVTGDDPILIGAAEAVEEIWRLTEVTKPEALPGIAGLVDFLFHAGRKGGCLRLMPARS